MVNQNQPITKIPAVRTYARDLEINREAAGITASAKEVDKATSVSKVAAQSNKPEVKRIYKGPSIIAEVPVAKKIVSAPKKLTEFSSKNTTFLVDNEDAASATIITDTKKDRFKLIPSVIASVEKWFESKKESFRKKKAPRYTVPETTRRKGVIQKATSVTGRFATSDFESIHDRIRQRKLDEEEEDSKPTTTWSANTEPGYLLLENPVVTPITNVKIEGKKSFRNTQPQALPKEKVIEKVVEIEVKIPEVVAPAVIVSPILPEPIPVVEYVPPEVIEVVRPEEEEVQVISEPIPKKKLPFQLLSLDTNTLSLGFSALVLAVIVVVAYGYFTFTSSTLTDNNIPTTNTTSETIINIPLEFVSSTGATREALLNTIDSNKPRGVGKGVQLVFLSPGENGTIVQPNVLLSVLNIGIEQNFSKTISVLRFGYSKDLTKFVLLKTTNTSATKGGLLMWENEMKKDLTGIFDFDSKQTSGLRFVDATLGGIDVRVLKNKDGLEEIVYGEVNNIVLITETSENFIELIKLKI